MSKVQQGTFVWYDLNTTDVEKAKTFYSEALGFKQVPFEEMPEYTMFAPVEGAPWGGVNKLSEEAVKMGAPPHWIAHIAVDDVDASVKKAKSLGGKIMHDPMDLPNVGRMAVVADPQGAVFSLFQDSGKSDAATDYNATATPGHPSWRELNATDWEASWKFYSELVGWEEHTKMDMGPEMGTYFMFNWKGSEAYRGGMGNGAKMMNSPAHWLLYFRVDDIDAAVKRIKDKGGKVMNGPMDVPGNSKVAQCQDPTGAFFGIEWVAPA